MRSKTANRILSETSDLTKKEVRENANKRLNIMTTREQAIQWWKDFDLNTKEYLFIKYHNRKAFNETGKEIEEIFRKENKTENIYLNRLKEQYKQSKLLVVQGNFYLSGYDKAKTYYDAMRLFCLDTQLISFNDIEVMEYEVNSSF